ncbi:MAG: glycosyl transferase family 1 [Chloroflexota bacterium]
MRILFISPYIPTPIRTRPYNLIRALARRGHAITLLALQAPGDPAAPPEEIIRACQRWATVPLPRGRVLWNTLWAIPQDLPLQAAYSCSPQMVGLIRQALKAVTSSSFDVVHIEHLRGALLGAVVQGVPKVYDAVDCISLLFERAWRQAPSWRHRLMAGIDLTRTRRFEGRIVAAMDAVLVSSPEDRAALARLCSADATARIAVLPNGVDLDYFRPADRDEVECSGVAFSGKMSYHANIAAALDLAQTIMPLVWEAYPETTLTIAGKDPPREVRGLGHDPRICVTGTVPDLRPILSRAAVVACPLRYGAGIQNKVLEAMALGRPVVASAQAAVALNAVPGRDLLMGRDLSEVAQHVIRLLGDPGLRREIGQAGRRYVEAHHDWDDIAGRLEGFYQGAISEEVCVGDALPSLRSG